VVSIWWHDLDQRPIRRPKHRGDVRGNGGERGGPDKICFCYRERVPSTSGFGHYLSHYSRNASEMATAVYRHSFWFQQHDRTLGSQTGHRNHHAVRALHRAAGCRNRRYKRYQSGRQHQVCQRKHHSSGAALGYPYVVSLFIARNQLLQSVPGHGKWRTL